MRKPKVFVVQEPVKWDRESGSWKKTMNIHPAAEYGEIVVCLPPGRVALSPAPTIMTLREALCGFTEGDYLVALGDPTAIAMASILVSNKMGGRFQMLKWDRDHSTYIKIDVDIHARLEGGH